jgi:hypothetical protein
LYFFDDLKTDALEVGGLVLRGAEGIINKLWLEANL